MFSTRENWPWFHPGFPALGWNPASHVSLNFWYRFQEIQLTLHYSRREKRRTSKKEQDISSRLFSQIYWAAENKTWQNIYFNQKDTTFQCVISKECSRTKLQMSISYLQPKTSADGSPFYQEYEKKLSKKRTTSIYMWLSIILIVKI